MQAYIMKKLAIVVLVGSVILFAGCRSSARRSLNNAIAEYNKSCPIYIDETTRIDSLSYDTSDDDVAYYYTLVGVPTDPQSRDLVISGVEAMGPRESREYLGQMMVSDAGRETLMILERVGATLSFVYQFDDGDPIARYTYSEENWK